MSYVAITLDYNHESMDLALPMHVPSHMLVKSLVQSLNRSKGGGKTYFLSVKGEGGLRRVPGNASLGDMTILHGMTLALLEDSNKGKPTIATSGGLQVENGATFSLTSSTSLIGRNDPKSGIFVEIDLTPYAPDAKIISRKHAQIEQEGGRFYLTDLGSVNGTKLNGQRLPARERKPLWDGDVIELGKAGIRMTFTCEGQLPRDG